MSAESRVSLSCPWYWVVDVCSQDQYEPARVFRKDDHHIDTYSRVSSLAFFKRDPIYDRITRRAMNIQGWRGLLAFFQPPYVQRYEVGGFYGEHYDWDPEFSEGNRITTFLVYLSDNCTGGGTNFPRLSRPHDKRWCDIIECQPSKGLDASAKGVTFKPNFGAAIFWENMHVNGSFNEDLLHASLPVLSGVKYGLNIFTWDLGWRAPTASEIPGAWCSFSAATSKMHRIVELPGKALVSQYPQDIYNAMQYSYFQNLRLQSHSWYLSSSCNLRTMSPNSQ